MICGCVLIHMREEIRMSSFLPISLLTIPISSDIEHTHTHTKVLEFGVESTI